MKEIYVVILPDNKTKEELEKIRISLKKKNNLKITNHPLHLTLRSTFNINDSDYDSLLLNLKRYCKRCSPFEVISNKYEAFNRKTMVLVFKKSKALEKLEKDIIKLCKKHMMFNKPFKKYKDALHQAYYNKYRDIYVLENYNPHMTLFYNIKDKEINLNELKSDFCFVCDSIAVVEKEKTIRGTLHTIKEIIKF